MTTREAQEFAKVLEEWRQGPLSAGCDISQSAELRGVVQEALVEAGVPWNVYSERWAASLLKTPLLQQTTYVDMAAYARLMFVEISAYTLQDALDWLLMHGDLNSAILRGFGKRAMDRAPSAPVLGSVWLTAMQHTRDAFVRAIPDAVLRCARRRLQQVDLDGQASGA